MINQTLGERNLRGAAVRVPATAFGVSPRPQPRALVHKYAQALSKALAPGQDLYRQGEQNSHVYVLLEGWAFRHQGLPDGRRQILDFLLPGSILGLAGRGVSTHGVEALTACSIAVLPRRAIVDWLQADPCSALELLEQLIENEARSFDHMTSLGRRSARERIAALMVELCGRVRAGSRVSPSGVITLPLKQTHIADALGLTNEHVCRTLKAMRTDGIMSLHEGQLHILDIAALAEAAGIEIEEPGEPAATRGSGWAAGRGARALGPSHLAHVA